MVTRLSCLFCALLGLLMLSGCTSGTDLNCVTVTIASVEPVTKGSVDHIAAKLRFANDNVVSVAASETDHKLYLNGEYVGECHSRTPVGMPAQGIVEEELTFTISKPDVVRQLAQSGHLVNYRLESRINVFVDTDHLVVKTDDKGTVDLRPLLAGN